jgi:hypothetical protein
VEWRKVCFIIDSRLIHMIEDLLRGKNIKHTRIQMRNHHGSLEKEITDPHGGNLTVGRRRVSCLSNGEVEERKQTKDVG